MHSSVTAHANPTDIKEKNGQKKRYRHISTSVPHRLYAAEAILFFNVLLLLIVGFSSDCPFPAITVQLPISLCLFVFSPLKA